MDLVGEKTVLPLTEETQVKLSEAIRTSSFHDFVQNHVITLDHLLLDKKEPWVTPLIHLIIWSGVDHVAEILKASGEKLPLQPLLREVNGILPLCLIAQYEQLKHLREVSEENLTLEHLLWKDSTKRTPLYWSAATGKMDQVFEALRISGETLPWAALLERANNGCSPLEIATINGHLDQLFTPSFWAHRVGEMAKLWENVPQEYRIQIDYDAVLKETILESRPPGQKWQRADYAGAAHPRMAGAETVLPQQKTR